MGPCNEGRAPGSSSCVTFRLEKRVSTSETKRQPFLALADARRCLGWQRSADPTLMSISESGYYCPIPLMGRAWGLVGASLLTVTTPLIAPVLVGVNVTTN